jgi:hypothetical protein
MADAASSLSVTEQDAAIAMAYKYHAFIERDTERFSFGPMACG